MSPTQDTRTPVSRQRRAGLLLGAGLAALLVNLAVCLAQGQAFTGFALWGVALMLGGVLALDLPTDPAITDIEETDQ